ncbi:hypothetical protein Btru_060347 [Bulinus truncatus]|nr:hypothetical protein Btru_060347 [Bulinus truncatus]
MATSETSVENYDMILDALKWFVFSKTDVRIFFKFLTMGQPRSVKILQHGPGILQQGPGNSRGGREPEPKKILAAPQACLPPHLYLFLDQLEMVVARTMSCQVSVT